METIPVYQMLAEIFAREGVGAHFTLMGDGNMHWATALAGEGIRTLYVRHEHCACAMATAYAMASGNVGLASVTHGPGLTQTMTALATAVRVDVPLVVFAGESPASAVWATHQFIDQAPLVTATGASYVSARDIGSLGQDVAAAFAIARSSRKPVVIGVPYDLQKKEVPRSYDYVPSSDRLSPPARRELSSDAVGKAVARIDAARRIVVIGGRGAYRSDAAEACRRLAETCGGLLATTLPVRGLFEEDPFSLGIAGGYSPGPVQDVLRQCDLVIAVGASLTSHTVESGKLFPAAKIIQIDARPGASERGMLRPDLYISADAKAGVEAIDAALRAARNETPPRWRSADDIRRAREARADDASFETSDGALDPRDVVAELDRTIPKDWEIVHGAGHCSYFSAQMSGRRAENFHTIREFGAIGNGLSYAIGVAIAKPDRPVLLIEGDGGFWMHAQELETIGRHNLKILICILNDGAYGSEIHKLRAEGLDDVGAVFGRGDLGALARGFGLRGTAVHELGRLDDLFAGFLAGDRTELWDVHISDDVTSPLMRKAHPKQHA